jgi:hypothetical protein
MRNGTTVTMVRSVSVVTIDRARLASGDAIGGEHCAMCMRAAIESIRAKYDKN